MKKTVAVLMVLVMILMLSASSFAVTAQYRMTGLFMEYMDKKGIKYTYKGIESGKDYEHITVKFGGDSMDTILLHFFFDADEDVVSIKIWNVIDYNASDSTNVSLLCDTLNRNYRYCKFYTDSEDNSVTISSDVILMNTDDCGEIMYETMMYVTNIADEAYTKLSLYAK